MTIVPLPTLDDLIADSARHVLFAGASGYGKTGALKLVAETKIRDPRLGFHLVDPEGEVAEHVIELIANPEHGLGWRKLHALRPASSSETFGLPLLYVPDRTPQLCHEAAIRCRTVFERVLNFGSGDYGPRISKLFQLACFGLALTGRSLTDLPELFSLGASRLRQLVGDAYPYEFMSAEWRLLDVLEERNLARFQEYCESIISRLMPTFGSPRNRRIFGPQQGLDFAALLANREVVLLDLSGLEHKDAVLIGTTYITLLYHHTIQRPPNRCARACLMIDELFDYLTPDLARGFDRFRKHMMQLVVAIQRLGQLQTKTPDGIDTTALNAILTNTDIKVFFGGLEPNDADLVARLLFTGHLDLCEWKDGSQRPVAVGQNKATVANWSRGESETEQSMRARSRSHSFGTARGTIESTSTSTGFGTSAGESSGLVLSPPLQLLGPNAPNASLIPMPLSQSRGDNTSESSFEQSSRAFGETYSEIDMHAEAETQARGTSRGTSRTNGESEVFVTRYDWMPSQLYSLQEQMDRATGELMNLPSRECFVKVGGNRPFRTRTADLKPPFHSLQFRSLMLPRFVAAAAARSPYIRAADAVDAEIAARFAPPLPKPEKPEPETWLESFEYPDPPPPPDVSRRKPRLRVVQSDGNK
jgi:hypothetical protein